MNYGEDKCSKNDPNSDRWIHFLFFFLCYIFSQFCTTPRGFSKGSICLPIRSVIAVWLFRWKKTKCYLFTLFLNKVSTSVCVCDKWWFKSHIKHSCFSANVIRTKNGRFQKILVMLNIFLRTFSVFFKLLI